ncbi:MAG: type II secretion system F family protein [Anaerolineales bacterium]|jgi:tight adherence protein B
MMTYILFIGGGLVFFLLMVGAVVSMMGERSLVEERLGPYFDEKELKEAKEKSSPVGDWLNTRVEKSSYGSRLGRELARADLKLKPAEYIALMVILGFGVGFVAWYFGGQNILVGLIGVGVGMLIPRFYVRQQQAKRLIRFSEQLPDMLNLMVNGLRAGFSVMQAMEAVSNELPPPISDEFKRVIQEIQIGLNIDRALDNLYRRIPSEDLDLTITAMNVQREVGGNLAEILDTISYTIRERVRIKGEIRVLTSQVVYSSRFLSSMPILIAVALWFMNRPYMMLFFAPDSRMIGIPVLIFGGLMIISGYMVMGKIAAIEV